MGRGRFAALLITICIICASFPTEAFALDEGVYFPDAKFSEADETFISGTVSMTLGQKRDISGFIRYGGKYKESGFEWRLTGTVQWSSSNPDVVSISGQGIAEAHRAGTARITAEGRDEAGRRYVQTVVVGATAGISAASAMDSFEISEGSWLDLSRLALLNSGAKDMEWASSVEDIASVDSQGVVLARSIGRCIITASYADESGIKHTLKYSVRVTSLILNHKTAQSSITLKAGDEIDIGGLFYPNYQKLPLALGKLSCYAFSRDVLSVDKLIITAKSEGTDTLAVVKTDGDEESVRYSIAVAVTG